MLRKLAFIAITFGHNEYGLKALVESEQLQASAQLTKRLQDRAFHRFLDEVSAC